MLAHRTPTFSALGLLAALALAGCTTGGAEAEAEESPTESAEESTGGLTTESGGDCLVGTWAIPEDQMQAFYDQLGAENGLTLTVTGFVGLNITESQYEYAPDFSMNLDISGAEATADARGTVRGDYTATDGVITTENDVSALDLQVVANGVPIDGSSLGNEIISSQPINSATYHCENGAPVIDFTTSSSSVPLTLEAR